MTVQTKEQVLYLLQGSQQDLRRFGVTRCGVFGSFVHNTAIVITNSTNLEKSEFLQDETLKRAYVRSIEII